VIDGVVITFEDITALKQTQAALNTLNAKLEQRERERGQSPEPTDPGDPK
jgi:hypothetical protein